MTELSEKQRKPVVKGRIYKTYQRTYRDGKITELFVIIGHYVYMRFRNYATKTTCVEGEKRLNWEYRQVPAKFKALNTDKGWAVYQRLQNTGTHAITPAILKDGNWWRNH